MNQVLRKYVRECARKGHARKHIERVWEIINKIDENDKP